MRPRPRPAHLPASLGSSRLGVIALVTLLALAGLALLATGCRPRGAEQAVDRGPFCTEHGVYEADCTICHPDLIPAFQAKNDWCAEHGLPESVCPKCRGSAAEPATGAGAEPGTEPSSDSPPAAGPSGPPATGTMIYIQHGDPAARAGIRCQDAGEGVVVATIEATARLAPDPARHALINARAPGVVVSLVAEAGDRIAAGQVLGHVESAEAGAEDSRRRAARARERAAEEAVQREDELLKLGLSTTREVNTARAELEDARAEVASAQAALRVIGGVGAGARYAITSPIAGVVTRRSVTVGSLAAAGDELFEVIDPSTLIAEIDVPETASAALAPGQPLTLTFHSAALARVRTSIKTIDAIVDPLTRMARARAIVDNGSGALRANMHATARIEAAAAGESAIVPRDAVQVIDGQPLVFTCVTEDSFEVRRVELGASSDDSVAVLAGVDPGEPIVVEGSFRLKTELRKDALGDGCCGVD